MPSLASRLLVRADPDPLEDSLRDRRVEQRLATGDAADRVDEVPAADLLENVPRGASHDRREQRLLVVVRRENQRLDRRVHRPHLTADVDAVSVRQPGVENRHVGAHGGHPAGSLQRRTGLPDDLDVVLVLEELAQPTPHDLVVVEQEDPDGPVIRHVAFVPSRTRCTKKELGR